MVQIVFSSPPATPPIPPTAWKGITVEWIGCDGSVWDLSSGDQGVALHPNVEGMHDPIMTKFSSVARAVPGKRGRGSRAEARSVFWPLKVYHDTSDDWIDTYDRFFTSIHPDRPGIWRVGYQGSFRELELTGVYPDGYAFGVHPTVLGWMDIGVELEAERPYWRGAPVKGGPWSAPAPVDFLDDEGSPPLHISESAAFGSATISNPGDEPAFLVWTIRDALTAVELGIGDRVIDVPFAVEAGEVVRIDTDPRNLTATRDGDDVTALLGLQPITPVPPGGSVSLHVEGTGSGSIEAELVPLHWRAIGRSRGA